MLFDAWLDAPLWIIMTVLAVGYGGVAGLLQWLSFHWPGRAFMATLVGVSPPFFTTIGLLFGLQTGFLASDIWDSQRRAVRSVQTERDTVSAIQSLSESTQPEPESTAIRVALREYVAAVVDDEWPRMAAQQTSPRADAAVSMLLRVTASPSVALRSGPVVQNAMLQRVQALRAARNERLSISTGNYDGAKWAIVLIVAVLVQASMAAVHLDRPRAQGTALVLFTTSVVLVLGLLALRERPFDGVYALRDTPLRALLPALAPF